MGGTSYEIKKPSGQAVCRFCPDGFLYAYNLLTLKNFMISGRNVTVNSVVTANTTALCSFFGSASPHITPAEQAQSLIITRSFQSAWRMKRLVYRINFFMAVTPSLSLPSKFSCLYFTTLSDQCHTLFLNIIKAHLICLLPLPVDIFERTH